ncbi:pancreatic secretory granule membrane major glycoprotein GP2-like isoform X2 [Protopterus annectens]|uniref:pancreatic secretory granule membrane major glycoprotein GP2-like isoform X2 n=1 Tax=Protopterus annectens TaxID=7888 RepID=UPI001CFA6F3C|nr:pancreatic secretory granule membrane major glycoprotein GP2-like isoform X2 [Protopterus annectens]
MGLNNMSPFLALIITFGIIGKVHSQCTRPCNYDEVCTNFTSDSSTLYYCDCNPELYDNPDYAALLNNIPVSCGPQQFSVDITSCLGRSMSQANFLLPDENQAENPCFYATYSPQPGTATFVYNFTSGSSSSCNPALSVNATHAAFSVPVWFKVNTTNQVVILYNDIMANYTCAYPLNMNTSLDFGVNPFLSTSNLTVAGVGTYTTVLQLCKNSNCTETYKPSDMPLYVRVESILYFKATVFGPDPSKFSLKIQTCYATPTNNSNDLTQYPLIQNGCPVAPGVILYIDGNSTTVEYSMRMIKFGDSPNVFIYARFILCLGTCTPSCRSRDGQQPNILGRTDISSGPFKVDAGGSIGETVSTGGNGSSASFATSWIIKVIPLLAMLLIKSM